METTYENIKKLRERKGMSQDELATLTGYSSRSSIAKIEKGLIDLQQSKLIAFAKALEVSVGELMGIEISQYSAMQLDEEEYTQEELCEIKRFADFLKSGHKKEQNHYFSNLEEAIKYLEKETSFVAAFESGIKDEEIILQMADAVYLQRNKNI